MPEGSDPIDRIVWRSAADLDPNSWNPNFVFGPEMRLLERNIILHGWVVPILTSRDDLIIDGYHRFVLTLESARLRERYKGRLPTTVMDVDRAEAMMLTVRMNRAKGTHAALRMSSLVQRLIDEEGASIEEVSVGIGAAPGEVELLYAGGVFKNRDLKEWKYSKAWIPKEVASDDAEESISFERDETVAPDRID